MPTSRLYRRKDVCASTRLWSAARSPLPTSKRRPPSSAMWRAGQGSARSDHTPGPRSRCRPSQRRNLALDADREPACDLWSAPSRACRPRCPVRSGPAAFATLAIDNSVQRFGPVVTQFAVPSGVTTRSESAANRLSCPSRRAQSRSWSRPGPLSGSLAAHRRSVQVRFGAPTGMRSPFASLQPRSEPVRAAPPSSLSAACADPSGTPAPGSPLSSRRGDHRLGYICPRVRRGNFRKKIRERGRCPVQASIVRIGVDDPRCHNGARLWRK